MVLCVDKTIKTGSTQFERYLFLFTHHMSVNKMFQIENLLLPKVYNKCYLKKPFRYVIILSGKFRYSGDKNGSCF